MRVRNIKKYILIMLCPVILSISACSSYEIPMVSNFYSMFSSSTPKASAVSKNRVIVRKGDTLYSISKEYGVSLRSLIEANRLRPPYTLSIGAKLRIPSSPYHIVKEGDTLYSISRRYGVDVRSLSRLNKISPPYSIYKGQRLALPGATELVKESVSSANSPKKSAKSSKSSASSAKATKTAKKGTNKTSNKKVVKIPTPPSRSGKAFAWPHKGKIVLDFGPAGSGRHNDGINIAVKSGDKVLAAENGVIAYAGNELKGFGNLVLIKHSGGWMTAYAHNETITVLRGQEVKRGQQIAKAGNTGNVTSPQLHFEIRKGSKALNPLLYLEKK